MNERTLRTESRILSTMLRILRENGWMPDAILLDEGWEKTTTNKAVRELFDNLDEITLRVKNAEGRTHGILLVRGNGQDLITDYSYSHTTNFDEVMNRILTYIER